MLILEGHSAETAQLVVASLYEGDPTATAALNAARGRQVTPDPGEPGTVRSRAKDTLPIVSFVFEPFEIVNPPRVGRYLTGLVVELDDGTWEHRDIDVSDWIVLGPTEPVRTGYLARLRRYLEPGWVGGRPAQREEAW